MDSRKSVFNRGCPKTEGKHVKMLVLSGVLAQTALAHAGETITLPNTEQMGLDSLTYKFAIVVLKPYSHIFTLARRKDTEQVVTAKSHHPAHYGKQK